MDTRREPDTYVIQRVSFGDKPSGTIATIALRKTAEMGQEQYPEAAKIIKDNTYVDDIIESVRDNRKARDVTIDIEKFIDNGGFKVKGRIISDDPDNRYEMVIPDDKHATTEKVLGVAWNPVADQFRRPVFFREKAEITNRTGFRTASDPREDSCEFD